MSSIALSIIQPRYCASRSVAVVLRLHVFLLMLLSSVPFNGLHAAELGDRTHLQQAMNLADTRHLLLRSGIGAAPTELENLIGKTRQQGIKQIILGLEKTPQIEPPSWIRAPVPRYWTRADMSNELRREFNRARDREVSQLRTWWAREMIETSSPQSERLVLFWHNHFTSAYSTIDNMSSAIARQHLLFRDLGSGNFRDLLSAIIRDAAMLNYLDNNSNSKKSPNENLAREFLELFTLGEGNYTEQDVKNAARALTGYSIGPLRDQQFRFERWEHDDTSKILFGQVGKFNGDDLVELVLRQPDVARHIASKFWKAYISDSDLDSMAIEDLASRFRVSDYDLKTLLNDTLSSSAFWAIENRGAMIKSPIDLIIGTVRSTGVVPENWQTIPAQLARLGQNLFEPPNVAGWSGGSAWMTPSHFLNRTHWLNGFIDSVCESCTFAGMNENEVANGMVNAMQSTDRNDMRSSMNSSMRMSNKIRVRLAADNFEGPPESRIQLKKDGKVVWQTPAFTVKGGRDTRQFGRTQGFAQKPWQVEAFEIDGDFPPFDSVAVAFLNDHGSNEGDRNLFVDWIEIGGEVFMASSGYQESTCPPKQKSYAGALYCTGTVTVNTNETQGPDDRTRSNRLHAKNVHLSWLNHPGKRKSHSASIAFVFSDLEYDGAHWENFYVQLRRTPEQKLLLQFDNFGCWPECIEEWPECTWQHHKVQLTRELVFPLEVPEAQSDIECHYSDLSKREKRFVANLWQSIPAIYDEVAKTRRARQRNNTERFHAWSPFIEKIRLQLPASRFAVISDENNGPALQIAGRFRAEVPTNMQALLENTPRTSNVSLTQTARAIKQLESNLLADAAPRGRAVANAPGDILIAVPRDAWLTSSIDATFSEAFKALEFQLK